MLSKFLEKFVQKVPIFPIKASFEKGLFFLILSLFSPLYADQLALEKQYTQAIEEPEAFIFIPPQGWLAVDPQLLPPSVKAMVVGKSEKSYPPSINIGMEPYSGSLKSYLKNIKRINESQNAIWKDMGQITTESGQASLSSVDMNTEWGDVRLLHAIIIKYGTAYIMTCGSLKDEFSHNSKDFFQAMRSIKINKDVYELVGHPELRAKLMNSVQKLKRDCHDLNVDKGFELFNEYLDEEFGQLGPKWKDCMVTRAKKDLGLQ